MFKFKDFVQRQNWISAKTYAETAPHQYIVRENVDDEEFVQAVKFIRRHGFKMHFWKKEYTYYFVDGHFYWTMGCSLDNTRIINRSNQDDYYVSIIPQKGKKE